MTETRDRPLGLIALAALGLNGVLGVGIFFVPASVSSYVPGSAGALVYAMTAAVCLPIALAFATLGKRFDEDGGPYVFARAAFGSNAAYVVGWIAYVSAIFSTAAVVRGLAQSLGVRPATQHLAMSLIVLGLAGVAATGLRLSAWVWTLVTVAKIVPLLMLVGAWVFTSPTVPCALSTPASPAPVGLSSILPAALLVLFALQGFEIVPVPAGHVRRAETVSQATVIALVVAAALYVALHLACAHALPDLARSQAPLVDAARAYGGPLLGSVLRCGTSVSAFGIAFGMIAMTPRYLSTLGKRDGLGTWLGQCDGRGIPRAALGITALAVLALVQIGTIHELFALSSIAVLTQYGSTALALTALASRRQRGLGKRDLAVGLAAAAASMLVVAGASVAQMIRAFALVAVGVLIKIVVGWRRVE